MQFSPEKGQKKENEFIQPIIPVDGLCYKMGVFDPSIVLIFFSFVSKSLTCNREKRAEMRQREWEAKTKSQRFSYALGIIYVSSSAICV